MPDKFADLAITPLTGAFDALSRPADLKAGDFRWKQNWSVSESGHLLRRDGFLRAFSSLPSGTDYNNRDLHRQSASVREPITFLKENTTPTGTRQLFAGTQSRVYVLDETSGDWTPIITGKGAEGTRWMGAGLKDKVLFTNNHDAPLMHTIGSSSASPITDNDGITRARVVIAFNGFLLLMNTVQDGVSYTSRVHWCDINNPDVWHRNPDLNVAGYQDLDYGEEILNAMELQNSVMIYTTRAIWRCTLSASSTRVFSFNRVYRDAESQHGCLAYPSALASDGEAHYLAANDGIYKMTVFSTAPNRLDWVLRSAALFYNKSDYPEYAADRSKCSLPVMQYRRPTETGRSDEIWLSWPDAASTSGNNHTLVLNVKHNTCDYVDVGFTSLVNFTPVGDCGTADVQFIGACSKDWGLKTIGNAIFIREYLYVADGKITNDITSPVFYNEGYNSTLRGEFPTGKANRDKTLKSLTLQTDIVNDSYDARFSLRIGNAYNDVDCNELNACGLQWKTFAPCPVKCPERFTSAQHAAANTRPTDDLSWMLWERGRHLYFELVIDSPSGPARGGNVALSALEYTVRPESV